MTDNYLHIDPRVRHWLPVNRPYKELEALIAHCLDVHEGVSWSVNRYAETWGWSRTKVENFIKALKSENGYHKDKHRKTTAGQGVRLLSKLQREFNEKSTMSAITKQEKAIENVELDEAKSTKKALRKHPINVKFAPEFEDFWTIYPRKVAKPKAHEAWQRLNPQTPLVEKILEAVKKQKASKDWIKDEGQFIPHPTTWLNQHRWEDQQETLTKGEPEWLK